MMMIYEQKIKENQMKDICNIFNEDISNCLLIKLIKIKISSFKNKHRFHAKF